MSECHDRGVALAAEDAALGAGMNETNGLAGSAGSAANVGRCGVLETKGVLLVDSISSPCSSVKNQFTRSPARAYVEF